MSLETFWGECHPNRSLMGMDVGSKTIGIAYSDRRWCIATPSHVIQRKSWSVTCRQVIEAACQRNVTGLIVGWPLHMTGEEGSQCQSVKDFSKNLIHVYDIPIVFWDERLSSWAAREAIEPTSFSAREKKSRIHASAAAIILQGALDYAEYAARNK